MLFSYAIYIKEFKMIDLGKLTYFLGMEFTEISEGLIMHQMKYVFDILKWFNTVSCNPSSSSVEVNLKQVMNEEEELVDPTLFKHIVGSLRYMCNSRPNIAYAVGIIRRFMSEPRASHLLAAKIVMTDEIHQRNTRVCILFPKCLNENSTEFIAYSDADWLGISKIGRAHQVTYSSF